MNCTYYSLNKAYVAPSPSDVKENYEEPKKYDMKLLTTYSYMDKLRIPNRIQEALKPTSDSLVQQFSVPSRNILHFRDGTFDSYANPPTSIFVQIPSTNIPVNSYIFISTARYPFPHFNSVIGNPEGYSDYSKRYQYANYNLIVVSKDGVPRTDLIKKEQTDLIFLELDNKAIPAGVNYKNEKVDVLFIFIRRPTDAQVPPNPKTIQEVINSKIPPIKLLISFT